MRLHTALTHLSVTLPSPISLALGLLGPLWPATRPSPTQRLSRSGSLAGKEGGCLGPLSPTHHPANMCALLWIFWQKGVHTFKGGWTTRVQNIWGGPKKIEFVEWNWNQRCCVCSFSFVLPWRTKDMASVLKWKALPFLWDRHRGSQSFSFLAMHFCPNSPLPSLTHVWCCRKLCWPILPLFRSHLPPGQSPVYSRSANALNLIPHRGSVCKRTLSYKSYSGSYSIEVLAVQSCMHGCMCGVA